MRQSAIFGIVLVLTMLAGLFMTEVRAADTEVDVGVDVDDVIVWKTRMNTTDGSWGEWNYKKT